VLSSSTNNFAHAQTLSRKSSLSGRMNIARVNIGFFTGFKTIKQRRISFVLGYLRMILWTNSTSISIKHRILATFNIKKKSILNACIPLINRQAIESENRTTIGQWSVDRRLKGAIVLPWNRQVLGEWNHLVFFT
jgi:hypothetical protein